MDIRTHQTGIIEPMTISFDDEKQQKKIEEFRRREEEDLARIIAERHSLEYVDFATMSISGDALRTISEEDARDAKIAPFSLIGKKLKIGILSPTQNRLGEIKDNLERKGYEVSLYIVSITSLEKAWNKYADMSFSVETKAGALDISSEDIKKFTEEVKGIEDVRRITGDIIKLKKAYRISKILEIVLSGALATKASDVHIEPEETYVRLRYRLDGVLTDILTFDQETYHLLLSRIKLLSGLKLNVKSEAQDGRFSIKITEGDIEVRTSILPGAYSESIVLRLLDSRSIQVPLEELGIPKKLLTRLLKEIEKPSGMILTTGPTGSGKTTTLYAFLRKIHSPGIKIITIEDPIEYHLPGITQTQVNDEKGYTFLNGLRSALRQDPDVIMVGEIRDDETAEIAINSSLTGHLVFSTLHTNSAAGAYPRLIDLEINPKILTSAINITLAQRLVRKLCPRCRKQIPLSDNDKVLIDKTLSGVVDKEELTGVQQTSYFKAGSCIECNNTGYKGRIGIYEAVFTDDSLEKAVQASSSEREIREATIHQGLLTMKQDGIIKVLQGLTSLDELTRVIDLESEY